MCVGSPNPRYTPSPRDLTIPKDWRREGGTVEQVSKNLVWKEAFLGHRQTRDPDRPASQEFPVVLEREVASWSATNS